MPAPPNGEVDFGVVDVDFLVDAYRGEGIYKKDGPRTNLRLIAKIDEPEYYMVATRREAFITDLHQIKERKLPVRILTQDSIRSRMILSYYGITREELASWGGELTMTAVLSTTDIQDRDNFDVVMSFMNSLNNTPESNIWYELSQRYNLRYLQLPDDLLESMAKASEWEVGPTPVRLLRGMDTPIKTIRTSGTVIFGRADLPDQFAYDVAKSLDEQKHVLVFSILPFSYDSAEVWQARGVPLHPGAERYYREKGYMPKAGN
jgi:TRAP transporter TAXI family solute receptor